MGSKVFGAKVAAGLSNKGWTQQKLAVAIGILPDGTTLDATRVRRIMQGTKELDAELVRRIIDALDLDPDEAWHAAGLAPPWLTVDHLRDLRERTQAATAFKRAYATDRRIAA